MMNKFKIALVSLENTPIPDWLRTSLAQEGAEFAAEECLNQEQLQRVAGDADIVWVRSGSEIVKAESLDFLKNCKAILRTGTGTDNVPVEEATRRGILVANTPEA